MKIDKLPEQQPEDTNQAETQFAYDVLTGLQQTPKRIPAKYFYDEQGSILFQQITSHPDYYLTRAEHSILDSIKDELASRLNTSELDIIELGVGDGHKTQLILDGFFQHGIKVNLYPIDISEKAMQQLAETLGQHELLSIHGVVAEYFSGLSHVRRHSNNQQLVLFLGSNIGNFNALQSQRFLKQLRAILSPGDHALIGFDLKKDISVLNAAYNDAAGYTREFNLNLLKRINRELGGEFDVNAFQHYGIYNPILGAMESYLISRHEQTVDIKTLESSFHFDAFEPIHLEYSFKYLRSDIEKMACDADFELVCHYSDGEDRFIDSLWTVV